MKPQLYTFLQHDAAHPSGDEVAVAVAVAVAAAAAAVVASEPFLITSSSQQSSPIEIILFFASFFPTKTE